ARRLCRGARPRRRAVGAHRPVGARLEIAARERRAAGEEGGGRGRRHEARGREGNLERGSRSDLSQVSRGRRAPHKGRRHVGRGEVIATRTRAKGLGLGAVVLSPQLLALSLFLAVSSFLAPCLIAADLPTLSDEPVNDFAHVIDAQSAQGIEKLSRSLKKASGDVVVVATVPTIEGYGSIDEYATKLFE